MLTEALAARFAAVALGHVRREYPNKPGNVMAGPQDARSPRDLHPVFYGSFDWHSCVHAYWMLARLLRLFPAMAPAGEIRALFDAQLTPEAVAGECATLQHPMAAGFERPYGWAWLLKLGEALTHLPEHRWHDALAPLTTIFASRFKSFLPKASYPVRTGTHFNTAFALALAHDYALTAGDLELMRDAGAFCCMCPTTERDLADGIGPVAGRLTVGSDSQSVIDPFEEARAVELDQRLATGTRGSFGAAALASALSADGYASLGWSEGGAIAPGALADLTTVGLDSVRLAGTESAHALDAAIFAGAGSDVSHVMVGGDLIVANGRHVRIDTADELGASIRAVWS